MKGEEPETVSCTVQQIKPNLYPKVEDEATIVLTYPKAQVIIQASWNWPHNVKDTEIYGKTGYILCKNSTDMVILQSGKTEPITHRASELEKGIHDPFALLQQVVMEGYELEEYDVSSLENNRIVMQILEAARHSADSGRTVFWEELYKD